MKRKILLRTALLATTLMLFGSVGWGQTVIFTESMGTVSATTTIAAHEAANGFDNDDFTMSSGGATNPGDLRATSVSSGYTGASGGANIWLTSTNAEYGFAIEGINAQSYTNLKLQFGYRKESSTLLPTLALDYWNGTEYINIPYNLNETPTAGTGWYISPEITLPVEAQISGLKLRWVKSGTVAVRIDDVKLTGITSTPVITSNPSLLTNLSYVENDGPSTSDIIKVSGENLNGSNVIITAPTYFEISETEVGTYNSNITLTSYNGSETDIFVRLVSGLTVNNYSGNIIITGGGLTEDVNVNVSGKVIQAFDIPYINNFRTQEDIDNALIQGLSLNSLVWGGTAGGGYTKISIGGYVQTPTIDFTSFDFLIVSYNMQTFGTGTDRTFSVKISKDNGTSFTTLSTEIVPGSYTTFTSYIDLTGEYNVATGMLRFEMTGGSAGETRFRDLNIEELKSSTWDGTGNWSDANWTPFAPLSYYDVIVNSGTLNVDASHEVATVTVNPGANLTIETGNTLTADKVTLKAGTDKTLASLINFGTLTASTVEYQRYMPNGAFEYVSSPVAGQTASVFGTLGENSGEGNGLFAFDVTADSWTAAITNGATPIVAMQGYAFIANSNQTVTFSGTAFNSGEQSIQLSKAATGFNLVGNPYPSAIDWDLETAWTRVDVSPNIWINFADAPTEANFATYNWDTNVETNWAANIGTDVGIIAPTQAFWVENISETPPPSYADLTVMPTAQVHSANVVNKKSTSENPLVRLQAQRSGYSDEMVIFFHSEATEGMDRYDTRKKLGSGAYPQIYAPVADAIAAVNTLPQSLLSDKVVVPITLKSDMAGSITLALTELKNLEEDMSITLTDKATGTQTDLRTAAYTVEVEAGSTLTGRFEVTVERKNTTSAPAIDKSTVNIYASAKNIYVGMAQQGSRVEVYNAIGVQMLSHTLNGSAVESIPTNLAKGVYIVVVNGSEGRTVKRVFIN